MATIASAPTSKEPKLGRISQRLSATTDEGPCCLMMKLLTPAPLDTPYPGPSASLLAYSVPYDDESRMNRREFQPLFYVHTPNERRSSRETVRDPHRAVKATSRCALQVLPLLREEEPRTPGEHYQGIHVHR